MKNFFISAFFTISLYNAHAQAFYNDDRDDYRNSLNRMAKFRNHLATNHISDVKVFGYSSKHPDGILFYETKYDIHGNAIENFSYNKHGRLFSHTENQYNDSNLATAHTRYGKNGKMLLGNTYTYNKSGEIIQYQSWEKDTANIIFRQAYEYTANNKPLKVVIYHSGGKLYCTTNYDYYDDGSKKKTTTYNRKGKVIAVWNYDCNPIGKLQESKMKDTSKICVHYETDENGNPLKVEEENTQGGVLFKYRLRKISKLDKDNHIIEYITTTMDGREKIHISNHYDPQGNITEHNEYVPNTKDLKMHYVYTYDSSGDMVQVTGYKKASTTGSITKFVYN